jgi:xanthine dehydrogenase accessory factor
MRWARPWPGLAEHDFDGHRLQIFVNKVILPAQILLCGAGRDAMPVCEAAAALGWLVSVADHRPALAQPRLFPAARRVVLAHPDELPQRLDLSPFDAGIIMSHHLASDVRYLDLLSRTGMRYIGLLGPKARREKILADLGHPLGEAESRLFGPVGLDIGATTPEGIALSIVAQIHAHLAQRPGGHFGRRA